MQTILLIIAAVAVAFLIAWLAVTGIQHFIDLREGKKHNDALKLDFMKRKSKMEKQAQAQRGELFASTLYSEVKNEIVHCANGHTFYLREFEYVHSTKITTEIQHEQVSSRSIGYGSVMNPQSHTYTPVTTYGMSSASVPVAVVNSEEDRRFGCPMCHTSRFTFERGGILFCRFCGGVYDDEFAECPMCVINGKFNAWLDEEERKLSSQLLQDPNKSRLFVSLLTDVAWIFPLLCGVIGFVVPTTVQKLKDQGMQELPTGLQFLVDLSDFCMSHLFVALPLLLILAVGISRLLAMRRGKNI